MKFKLPEPVLIGMEQTNFNEFRAGYGYTEAQLKQAIKDALEQAAQECETHLHRDYMGDVFDYGPDLPANPEKMKCINAIRKMIGEI